MITFAERVIEFNKNLRLGVTLPENIRVMNPFTENPAALEASSAFYRKYYSDNRKRLLILGINPGRFGAGVTGIPFTDTKRLEEKCGIKISGFTSHEPSSVFVYEMIEAFGGPEAFYSAFYINSPSPLGFLTRNTAGREVNYNYYDSIVLARLVRPFMVESIKAHISMGTATERAFCLGTGKNFRYLNSLNGEYHFFRELVPLEHPRYIMQYKSKQKHEYIDKYLEAFGISGQALY